MSHIRDVPEIQADGVRTLASHRKKWISAAHSPLGFCVLALLIVEAFLGGAGVGFDLPLTWRVAALAVGVVLFLIVFFAVIWLVVKYPKNLVFGEESHVQVAAMSYASKNNRSIPASETPKISDSGERPDALLRLGGPEHAKDDAEDE